MQEAGGPGYKYLEVDEDEAANVIFCNGTMVHLASDQIVESAKVSCVSFVRIAWTQLVVCV